MQLKFLKLKRDASKGKYFLSQIVEGLENSLALAFFGTTPERRKDALAKVQVEIIHDEGFMYVTQSGLLTISINHWKNSDEICIFLDLIHELVHVHQAAQGKDLYDETYEYWERPTEIEAYRTAMLEAKRLSIPERYIQDHMDVPWITKDEYKRLEKAVISASASTA